VALTERTGSKPPGAHIDRVFVTDPAETDQAYSGANSVTIISFSGIDGAGKDHATFQLEDGSIASGSAPNSSPFGTMSSAFSRYREFIELQASRRPAAWGSPEKPLHRRDKNVTSAPVTVMRFGTLIRRRLESCRKVRLRHEQARRVDVVIFDRYIYDELALDLPERNFRPEVLPGGC